MSLPPDQSPSAPLKQLSAEESRARQTDRLIMTRLRMAIRQELADRGIIKPAAIGQVLGMPAPEAAKLLKGDVELLEAAAARLGVQVPSL